MTTTPSKSSPKALNRCPWCGDDPLYMTYHDQEWGVPVYDDDRLFELLILEGAQAGLSWLTILRKRERYRKVYRNFNPGSVARFPATKLESLANDPGIVRHRGKIAASVSNAHAFLDVQSEFGSFAEYLWSFVDGSPLQNRWHQLEDVPVSTPISEAMSKDLKKRGFRFVGATICYAYMQAAGLVNDHLTSCWRHGELA